MPNAPSPTPTYSAEMERLARARGFPSAEAMAAWVRQQSRPRTQQTVSGRSQTPASAPEVRDQASAWHPRRMFNYLAETLRNAAE